MSLAKHFTEWSKEDKDALARQLMEEMEIKNEEIRRRHAEVEADRRKAEQQNSSVTLKIRGKSPPPDMDNKFFDDSSRIRGSGYEDHDEDLRRNFSNSGGQRYRGGRQGRNPHEQEYPRGSDMSEKEKEAYKRWKAERDKIDEERIARHKVKREWDEDKVEQEPELANPLPSKFCREPSWAPKQGDRPQRKNFNQRGSYGSGRTHFKGSRQNYESEDSEWHDKLGTSFDKPRSNAFSSSDRQAKISLSDDEDNKYSNRQQKGDNVDNHSSGFRRNLVGGGNDFNLRSRGRGGGFSQGARNEYRSNANSSFNNSYVKSSNNPDSNIVRPSRTPNVSYNSPDFRNDNQDTSYKNRSHGNEYSYSKSWARQSSSGWSGDEDDNKTNARPSDQKSSASRKQSSGTWSDDESPKNKSSPSHKQSSGTWSDDDNHVSKTVPKQSLQKSNNSASLKTAVKRAGSGWSDEDDNSATVKPNTRQFPPKYNRSYSAQGKQSSSGWSDDDDSKTKKSVGSKDHVSSGTWSDIDNDDAIRKAKNDDPWLDDHNKNESYSSKCANYPEKPRKRIGEQPPKSFPAGRGRKWSFEPSRQHNVVASNTSHDNDLMNENRDIKVQSNDSLTITVGNVAGGKRSFPQKPLKSEDTHYKNADRSPRGLSRSLSDADKHNVSDPQRRFDDNRGREEDFRNFRGRGISSGRGSFSRSSFESSSPSSQNNWYKGPPRGSHHSGSEERNQNRFQGATRNETRGGRGNFRGRGPRRYAETRKYPESDAQHRGNKLQQDEDGWGDVNEGSGVIHSEDTWEDTDISGNADLDHGWIGDDTNKVKEVKSKLNTDDGWETEDVNTSPLHASKRKDNDNGWQSGDIKKNQSPEETESSWSGKDKGQAKQDGWESLPENTKENVDRNIHQSSHDQASNPDCACDESHDDGSWVTTSGDEFEEELGEGEYIDDDDVNLHISSGQPCEGGDVSSPELYEPNFICSLGEFLSKRTSSDVHFHGEAKIVTTHSSVLIQEASEEIEKDKTVTGVLPSCEPELHVGIENESQFDTSLGNRELQNCGPLSSDLENRHEGEEMCERNVCQDVSNVCGTQDNKTQPNAKTQLAPESECKNNSYLITSEESSTNDHSVSCSSGENANDLSDKSVCSEVPCNSSVDGSALDLHKDVSICAETSCRPDVDDSTLDSSSNVPTRSEVLCSSSVDNKTVPVSQSDSYSAGKCVSKSDAESKEIPGKSNSEDIHNSSLCPDSQEAVPETEAQLPFELVSTCENHDVLASGDSCSIDQKIYPSACAPSSDNTIMPACGAPHNSELGCSVSLHSEAQSDSAIIHSAFELKSVAESLQQNTDKSQEDRTGNFTNFSENNNCEVVDVPSGNINSSEQGQEKILEIEHCNVPASEISVAAEVGIVSPSAAHQLDSACKVVDSEASTLSQHVELNNESVPAESCTSSAMTT